MELGPHLRFREGEIPTGIDLVLVKIGGHVDPVGLVAVGAEDADGFLAVLGSPGAVPPPEFLVAVWALLLLLRGGGGGGRFEPDQHHEQGLLDPLDFDLQTASAAQRLGSRQRCTAQDLRAGVRVRAATVLARAESALAWVHDFVSVTVAAVSVDVLDHLTHDFGRFFFWALVALALTLRMTGGGLNLVYQS